MRGLLPPPGCASRPAAARVMASLPLQMCLYFNVYYSILWTVISAPSIFHKVQTFQVRATLAGFFRTVVVGPLNHPAPPPARRPPPATRSSSSSGSCCRR